jgi:hypothetical protein
VLTSSYENIRLAFSVVNTFSKSFKKLKNALFLNLASPVISSFLPVTGLTAVFSARFTRFFSVQGSNHLIGVFRLSEMNLEFRNPVS